MKIEFKQSFMEEEKEYKIKYKGKAEQAEVPVYFFFLQTFFHMLKSGLIKILEVSNEEFGSMPQKYKDIELSEEDESIIEAAVESAVLKEESEEDEGAEDDKEPSTSSDSSDSVSESSQGSEGHQEQTGGQELPQSQNADEDVSEKLKKEYAFLHEKAKRLNKKEKERYEELKAQLKIEG